MYVYNLHMDEQYRLPKPGDSMMEYLMIYEAGEGWWIWCVEEETFVTCLHTKAEAEEFIDWRMYGDVRGW